MGRVPSQHRHPSHGFRPDPSEFSAASAELDARSETVGAFLRACLRWLARDPDAALAALAGSWPDPRPAGRPPRTTTAAAAEPPEPADGDQCSARPPEPAVHDTDQEG